jgi:uncharacterized membrane protein YkoI
LAGWKETQMDARMFGWFKKKQKDKSKSPQLADLDGNPLQEGDKVEALRYELGISHLQKSKGGWVYQSEVSGQEISWLKMVDAQTGNQKVKKIIAKGS